VAGPDGRRWTVERRCPEWRPRWDRLGLARGESLRPPRPEDGPRPWVADGRTSYEALMRMGGAAVAAPVLVAESLVWLGHGAAQLTNRTLRRRAWRIDARSDLPTPVAYRCDVVGWRESRAEARRVAARLREGAPMPVEWTESPSWEPWSRGGAS
jgi:hypothetical protein